jgi:hypothetical protein
MTIPRPAHAGGTKLTRNGALLIAGALVALAIGLIGGTA